ncbi:MAG: FliA/WhiG family RNA polymerase sigma factor [bacterium]
MMERDRDRREGGGCGPAVMDRDEAVRELMWLVKCVARSTAGSLPDSVDVEDLIGAGAVGLIQAVENYDPARGANLETYARYRIRGAILDELRRGDRLPQGTRAKLKKVERAVEALELKTGRYPTDDEIALEAGLAAEDVPVLFSAAAAADLYSLEEVFESASGEARLDLGEINRETPDPLSRLERKELERKLVRAIRDLPRTEKIVLSLYYYEGLRMREIGEVLGISESRISQIHSRAVLLLRGKLRARVWAGDRDGPDRL